MRGWCVLDSDLKMRLWRKVIAMDAERMKKIDQEWDYKWEYWRKDCQRIEHVSKLVQAEAVDAVQQTRLMRKELAEATAKREQDAATIGQLLHRLDQLAAAQATLQDRLDKASEVVTSIRRDLKPVGAK